MNYTYKQCLSCSEGNLPCLECHYDIVTNNFICDKCMDEYIKNEYGMCELIECEEYPEITPGCVICSDKINEYKPLKKCQSCKSGFFKTKDESCAFCKSLKNGGIFCDICEYEKDENGTETNEIKCRYCNRFPFNSLGKCNADENDYEIGLKCKDYDFISSEDNSIEKLVCTDCYDNYKLVNGSCINKNEYEDYIDYMYNEAYKYNIPTCRSEYFINDKGGCDYYTVENCSLSSIFSNKNSSSYSNCVSMCQNTDKYVSIEYYYELDNESDKNIYKLDGICHKTLINSHIIREAFSVIKILQIAQNVIIYLLKGLVLLRQMKEYLNVQNA